MREWEYIHSRRSGWHIPDSKSTLEAQLMDLCDDIAYSTHDLEDGIRAGKIEFYDNLFVNKNKEMVKVLAGLLEDDIKKKAEVKFAWLNVKELKNEVSIILTDVVKEWENSMLYAGDKSSARREFKSRLVNEFANAINVVPDGEWGRITMVKNGMENTYLLRKVHVLKKLAWVTMINDLRVQRLQMRSETILKGLWDVFTRENSKGNIFKLLPHHWERRQRFWSSHIRMIGDYIAGMTDAYAEKVYGEFYGGKAGSIYERD